MSDAGCRWSRTARRRRWGVAPTTTLRLRVRAPSSDGTPRGAGARSPFPEANSRQVNGTLLRTGGFGLASAANLAKRLGMTYAYELDGGGSTTLWTRTASDWKRRDLYGVSNPTECICERWMTNGLSFVLP